MKNKKIIYIIFILYSVLMIWLLFIQRIGYINYGNYFFQLGEKINIIPFRTILEYINTDSDNFRHAFINLAGNIVMFVPLGFFLPFIKTSCNKIISIISYTVIIIFIIELIQLFTLTGSFDIDDIILNTAGSVMGYSFYRFIFKNKH